MSSSAQEGVSRIYTINLGKAQLTPRYRRTDRVVNMIREFASRHMKTDEVKLDQELNRQVWKKGKANPPRRLRVRMIKDEDGVVIVSPYEEATKKGIDEEAIPTGEDVGHEPKPEPSPEIEEENLKEQSKTQEKEKETKKAKIGKKRSKTKAKKSEKK
jgi:large subunit ribosomal protein L31e